MATKDRKFPIIFLIVAVVLTFGVLLINSFSKNITGSAVGSAGVSFVLAIPWILLIVFALVVGVFILKGHGR